MRSKPVQSRALFLALALVLAFSLAGAPQPAQAATSTVYNAVDDILAYNYTSLGFQATQTDEYGDYVHLAGTYRIAQSVTVTMSAWALHSTYPSMDASGWTHPITLNLYNVIPDSPLNQKGSLIATVTQTMNIPWRPEADPTCSGGTAWRAADGLCYNGYAFNIVFDLAGLGIVLPDDVIVGIAYNTQTYGAAPLGVGGPWNSLNVATSSTATVGTDDNTDRVFWDTSTAGWYTDGGAGGVGIFREDTNWTPYGTVNIRIDCQDGAFPLVVSGDPAQAAVITEPGPSELFYTFNESVKNDDSAGSARNVENYLLLEDGEDGIFQTVDCAGGPLGDDLTFSIDDASYDRELYTVTLVVNGGVPLPVGNYRLLICGTTSIEDLEGNKLNNGLSDAIYAFRVAGRAAPAALPATGFAPGAVTMLPQQGVDYAASGLVLEIPRLGVKTDILGVPQVDGNWDVSWLGRNAGWLQGTAFPTWNGNSVLTAHVWNADNSAGPFVYLNTLWYGDQIIVHAWGQEYIYEVRSVKLVRPDDTRLIAQHEELPWLTLVTCRGYDEATGTYRHRVIVRAVQIGIR